jgi:iron complex outermembrane receptor protein
MKKILPFLTLLFLSNLLFSQSESDTIFLNSIDLEEVKVNALRAQERTPITFTNIKKADLEKINVGEDMPTLLSLSPSVVATSDGGTGVGHTYLRIRGTDPSRINITINGVPFNNPEYNFVYWVDLPDFTSSVSNIQIQRGVGTSSNGAASFGANINLKTANYNIKPYFSTANSYGSYNTRKHNISFGTGKLENNTSFDGRLSRISSDGFVDQSSTEQNSLFLSGSYFGEDYAIKGLLFGGNVRTLLAIFGVPKDSLDSETGITYNSIGYEDATDNYGNLNSQLHFTKQLNSNTSYNISTHYSKGGGPFKWKNHQYFSDLGVEDVIIGGDTILSTDVVNWYTLDNHFGGMTYALTHNLEKGKITFGGASNYYKNTHQQVIHWAEFASTLGNDYVAHTNKSVKRDNNAFLKFEYEPFYNTSIYTDMQVRTIHYSIKGEDLGGRKHDINTNNTFFNPKIGVSQIMGDKHSAFVSFGIANKEPHKNDYIYAEIGKVPSPENLKDLEFGYKFRSDKVLLSTNFYFMHYKDQLIETGEINELGNLVRGNVPNSSRKGIEIESAISLTSKLSLNANITLSQNKIKEYTEYVDDWDGEQNEVIHTKTDIAFSPNVIGSSQLNYALTKNLSTNFISKYVGEQYMDNTTNQSRKLDAYLVHKLLISYSLKSKFFKTAKVNLLVNNLFNTNYVANAWTYHFISAGYDPTPNDAYTSANNDKDGYNMTGYFPQAGRNFLLGITLGF